MYCLQVLLPFSAKMSGDHHCQAAEQDLVYGRYYALQQPKLAGDRAANLTMQHVVWEQRGSQPCYAVDPASSMLQRVCVCPQFKFWSKGQQQHFFVNDLSE